MKSSNQMKYRKTWITLAVTFAQITLTQGQSYAQGGGVIGSGGDGLFLDTKEVRTQGSVVEVPVPDDLRNYGRFRLAGQPGKDQDEKYNLEACDSLDFVHANCFVSTQLLNQDVKLASGMIIRSIEYSDTYSDFEQRGNYPVINRGKETRIELKKIRVPRVDGSYQFQVFDDLTIPSEQKQIARLIQWHNSVKEKNGFALDPIQDFFVKQFFSSIRLVSYKLTEVETGSWWNKKKTNVYVEDGILTINKDNISDFCHGVLSGDIKASAILKNVCSTEEQVQDQLAHGIPVSLNDLAKAHIIGFESDGKYTSYDIWDFRDKGICKQPKPEENNRITDCSLEPRTESYYHLVSDPSDGDFISVLPGVYGIEFTGPDGQKSRTLGIHVD